MRKSAVLTLSGKGEMGDPITIVTVDETTIQQQPVIVQMLCRGIRLTSRSKKW